MAETILQPPRGRWPKILPESTGEDRRIADDFMAYWLGILPQRYGIVERFNHGFPASVRPDGFLRTLEIGAGRCEHLDWEDLTPGQRREYYANEFRPSVAALIRERFPDIQVVEADCQKQMDFPDGYFDRILAIHVLEHLPDLPGALREARRLCHPERGVMVIVIPCIGGLAYRVAQQISAARIFRKRYGKPYSTFIDREHINAPWEILGEAARWFHVDRTAHFPLAIPWVHINVCMAAVLRPKKTV